MTSGDFVRSGVSEKTLNEAPERAFRFIFAVADNVGIASALAEVGYTPREHAKGLELVVALGSASGLFSNGPKGVGNKASAAVAALDSLDEKWFGIAGATLRANYPAIHEVFFDGLSASRGQTSVIGWHTFAARYDELKAVATTKAKPRAKGAKQSEAGEASAEEQRDAKGALDVLAERGVNEAFMDHIKGLLASASTLVAVTLPTEQEREAKGKREAESLKAREKLYVWYRQWADIAASVITRRDWLIALGIAERRSSKATGEGEGEEKE